MADRIIVVCAPSENSIKIKKWRVREGFPVTNSQVILLYEIPGSDDKEVKRLKSCKSGVVKNRLFQEGKIVNKGEPILELSECIHTTVIKDMCADCGADLRQNENGNTSHEASVPMVHSVPELKVTQKLAQKLGQADTLRLLEDRKLVLLVDLDQTIIHTTNDNVPNNIRGIYHFQLYGPNSPWYHTRLRPCTLDFLNKIAPYFELHICTFGARNYAHTIAQFLDPDGKFFSHRILSRDECFNVTSKTDNLKALFPCGDSMVCIIDDREDVWNMASNLIQVKPYHFFQTTGDINAPPGLSKHELDGKGIDFKAMAALKKGQNSDVKDSKKAEKAPQSKGNKETDGKSEEKKPVTTKKLEERSEKSTEKSTDLEKPVEEGIVKESECKTEEQNQEEVPTEQKNNTENQKHAPTEEKDVKTDNSTHEIEKEAEVNDKTNTEAAKETQDSISKTEDTDRIIEVVNTDEEDEEMPSEKPPPPEEPKDSQIEKSKDEIETAKKPKPDNMIDIEDPDDYLLHLEEILKKIHARFYDIYDRTKEIPDLKVLIPKFRSEVLLDKHLVFSGLIPNHMRLDQSRAYMIARSLGASVSQHLTDQTTHLVAVTAGTLKVNAARKRTGINIVTPDWLWGCAERWEHVDEKLYPLDPHKPSKMRQPPPHCHSPEHVVNYNEKTEISSEQPEPKFIDTINPLLSFSNADLAEMNQEFDQFFESDSSSDDEPVNIENPPLDKKLRKRKREEEKEERQRQFFNRTDGPQIVVTNENAEKETNSSAEDDEDESPSTKFRRGEDLPSDLDLGSNSGGSDDPIDEEDDGDWNMMGAALEREFLGLE